jgi:6-pyruvoyltetrahydropterin/6-carboxytetrahydropterin synthase
MLVDLGQLGAAIAHVREMLDHRFLDEVEGLGRPTLENLCAFIRRHLEPQMPLLRAVMVERRLSGDRCLLRWG